MNETLRKRLTGAVVLIALGIFLPFALSQWLSDPAPVNGDSVRVYEITPQGEARPVADPEPEPGANTPPEPAPAISDPPPSEDETTMLGPEIVSEPEPEPEPPMEPESDDTVVEKEQSSGESWAVQVGSFRAEENARSLMNELASDFPAFYGKSDVDGVTYYRVRVGPYADERQAQRAAEALIERGRNAQVRHEP